MSYAKTFSLKIKWSFVQYSCYKMLRGVFEKDLEIITIRLQFWLDFLKLKKKIARNKNGCIIRVLGQKSSWWSIIARKLSKFRLETRNLRKWNSSQNLTTSFQKYFISITKKLFVKQFWPRLREKWILGGKAQI